MEEQRPKYCELCGNPSIGLCDGLCQRCFEEQQEYMDEAE